MNAYKSNKILLHSHNSECCKRVYVCFLSKTRGNKLYIACVYVDRLKGIKNNNEPI